MFSLRQWKIKNAQKFMQKLVKFIQKKNQIFYGIFYFGKTQFQKFLLLISWELPIVIKGWKKDLSEDDLYSPLKEIDSKSLGDHLEQLWFEEENFQKKPSLARAIRRQFGWEIFKFGIIYFPVDLAVV